MTKSVAAMLVAGLLLLVACQNPVVPASSPPTSSVVPSGGPTSPSPASTASRGPAEHRSAITGQRRVAHAVADHGRCCHANPHADPGATDR